ncbi:MAG: hypothetical protein LBI80_05975 [Endomicrobium sp.]|jgi:hypothetical protein|nr:hypothetical protein [Endomicrobium sp.]
MKKEYERRRSILEKAQKLKEKGLILKEISKIVGVSQRTIKRGKKYKREIERLREENPYYGKVKIRELLLRKGYKIGLSSVGNGIKKLIESKRVSKVSVLNCENERKQIRKLNDHSQRLPKEYRAQIQIDHIKGKQIRQFCASGCQKLPL